MIRALPIDVFGDPEAHYPVARCIPGSADATAPTQWRESGQIPTFGKLTGEFTGILKERMFHVGVRELWRGDRLDRTAEFFRSVQR